MKDITRINLKNDTYHELSKSKAAMGLKTFDAVVSYIMENQRPIDHQIELDAEMTKTAAYRKQQEIHMRETQQVIQDIECLCRYMKENGIAFEMPDEMLSDFHPEIKKILEQSVIIPKPTRRENNEMNYFTPTVKVPDFVNEDVE